MGHEEDPFPHLLRLLGGLERGDSIKINGAQFQEFKDAQVRTRGDWPATFSCNAHREVWPFSTYSHTHHSDRIPVAGQIPILDQIVGKFLQINPRGGRFHIDDAGAYFADDKKQFVEFDFE